jgi:hypothetical protein
VTKVKIEELVTINNESESSKKRRRFLCFANHFHWCYNSVMLFCTLHFASKILNSPNFDYTDFFYDWCWMVLGLFKIFDGSL